MKNNFFVFIINIFCFCFVSTCINGQVNNCNYDLKQAIYKYKSNKFASVTKNFSIDCLKKGEKSVSFPDKLKGFKLLIESYKAMDDDYYANKLFRKLQSWYYPFDSEWKVQNILDETVISL